MTVAWDKITIPLAAGMQNRTEDRALEPPSLEVCLNAEFDELGGIRKRRPFVQLFEDPSGNADVRRVVGYGDELVVFTSEGLYTYNELDGDSVLRATYLAATVAEAPRFTRTTEQEGADRAELNGIAVLAWQDTGGGSTTVRFSAYEKSTGAVVLSERSLGTAYYPRLIALQNKVLLIYGQSSVLYARVLDCSTVAALQTSAATSSVAVATLLHATNPAIDVAAATATTAVVTYRTTTATCSARIISEAAATTASNLSARTVDDATAVAVAPGGEILVFRNVGTAIEADLLTSALGDSTVSIAVGSGTTAINQIAAAFKATQDGGQYRCHAFWSSKETNSPTSNFECQTNYVDDAGAAGTASVLVNRLGVASRAFEYQVPDAGTSRVFVWLTFAVGSTTGSTSYSQLQNTYFLYDHDGNLHAQAVPGAGGGFAQLTGHLPNVQAVSATEYAAVLSERRVFRLDGDDTDFAARSPREVVLTFDDDQARRTARIGRTLYLAGALVSQFDGVALHELGFPVAPYYCDGLDTGAGNIADGTYAYQVTANWENAKGELERSTSVGSDNVLMVGGGSTGGITTNPVHVTSKLDPPVSYEIWRSAVDPVLDSPRYLVTGKDPGATGTNGYLENDPTLGDFPTYTDDLKDGPETSGDYLVKHETFGETGALLSSLAPPSATIIAAGVDRLFLGGLAGNPQRVVYSKLRGAEELAHFSDGLYVDLPVAAGAVTGISFVNDIPVAFCARGIFALIGAGFDNLGGGANYAPRLVSTDVGATSADAMAVTPRGVVFHSAKGWHLLDRALSVLYIGAAVSDYDAYTFTSVDVVKDQHQIRCFGYSGGAGVALVLDTVADQWSAWELSLSIDATMYRDRYVLTDGTDVNQQVAAHGTGVYSYSLDLETAWIKLDGLQGFRRVRRLLVLGEYRTAHRLRVRIAYDYDDTWIDEFLWAPSPTTVGGPEQVEVRPSRPKGQAIKLRLTCRHASTDTPAPDEALTLTGLTLEVGTKRKSYRALPAAQKT